MLAADVPLWFAALGLAATGLTALATQLITGKQNAGRMTHESTEHDKDRDHAIRIEVRRELRAERIDLYRRLIEAARTVLQVHPSIARALERARREREREAQPAPPSDEPAWIGAPAADIDAWHEVLTETELVGSPSVIAAARAVEERFGEMNELWADRDIAKLVLGSAPNRDLVVQVAESRIYVQALVQACSDDLASRVPD